MHPPGLDHLDAIRIEGNHAIETGALEPALALHESVREGVAIDPYLLAADAERLRAAYLKRGFFQATVATRVERRGEHAQIVVFTVVEGRRATTRVEIRGLPPELAPPAARALVALVDGAPFDYAAYDAAKLPLGALVANAGYAHVDVQSSVIADPAAALATARYVVVPGVRCTFGAIRFTGTVRPALVAAVRARLGFATGDRYSLDALAASETAIYELGRFSAVQLTADRGDGGDQRNVIDVVVGLSEANRHEVHGGVGIGIEPETYEARLRGGGSVVPASQPLWTLALDARVAITIPHGFDLHDVLPKVRGVLSLQRVDLFRPRLRGEIEIGADYQTVEAYTWTGKHVRVGLGSPLGPRWLQLQIGWLLEQLTFPTHDDSLDPPPPPAPPVCEGAAQQLGLCGSQILGAYQASLVADLRDNPIEPHRGVYIDLRVSRGTPLAGGELTYLRLTPELRGYLPLAGVVIAARARVGALLGEAPVPVTERYYSGGTLGQRGFSNRALSPQAPSCVSGTNPNEDAVVVGGAGLIETGVELRRQLGTLWTQPVGANVFLDGGDVQCRPEDLAAGKLTWAIGAGGWAKLVGDLKFRVDVGYRLNSTPLYPRPSDGGLLEPFAFHIGFGEVY